LQPKNYSKKRNYQRMNGSKFLHQFSNNPKIIVGNPKHKIIPGSNKITSMQQSLRQNASSDLVKDGIYNFKNVIHQKATQLVNQMTKRKANKTLSLNIAKINHTS
jgi:hypothetical protein